MIANESIDYGKCTVIAALCGVALAAISGAIPPSTIGAVLTWLSGVAGSQVYAWFSSKTAKADPAAKEIFKNHDIQTLLKRAVQKALEMKAAEHKESSGSVSDAFRDAAKRVANHLSRIVNDPQGAFAELSEGNITLLLTRYVESQGKTDLLEPGTWGKFVDEVVSRDELSVNEYNAIINGLTKHFGAALWGIVKLDASQDGKGHAAVEMLYFSQILKAVSHGSKGRSLPECLTVIVERIDDLKGHIDKELAPFFSSVTFNLENLQTKIEESHQHMVRSHGRLEEGIRTVAEKQDRDSSILAELRRLLESMEGSIRGAHIRDYEVIAAVVAEKFRISVGQLKGIAKSDAIRVISLPNATVEEKIRALEVAGEFQQALNVMLISASTLAERRREISLATAEMWVASASSEIALGLYESALAHAESAAGILDPATDFRCWARARHQQGRAFFYLGRSDDAMVLFENLVSLRVEVLGKSHEETLASMNSLAATYRSLKRLRESVELVREVIEIRMSDPELQTPALFIAQSNLARALYDLGEFQEALELHENTLVSREEVLGDSHPDVLKSGFYIACCKCALNQESEGEELHRKVLQQRRSLLGEDHPDTLRSYFELAFLLSSLSQLEEAMNLAVTASDGFASALGPDHPETISAVSLMERIRERVIGPASKV